MTDKQERLASAELLQRVTPLAPNTARLEEEPFFDCDAGELRHAIEATGIVAARVGTITLTAISPTSALATGRGREDRMLAVAIAAHTARGTLTLRHEALRGIVARTTSDTERLTARLEHPGLAVVSGGGARCAFERYDAHGYSIGSGRTRIPTAALTAALPSGVIERTEMDPGEWACAVTIGHESVTLARRTGRTILATTTAAETADLYSDSALILPVLDVARLTTVWTEPYIDLRVGTRADLELYVALRCGEAVARFPTLEDRLGLRYSIDALRQQGRPTAQATRQDLVSAAEAAEGSAATVLIYGDRVGIAQRTVHAITTDAPAGGPFVVATVADLRAALAQLSSDRVELRIVDGHARGLVLAEVDPSTAWRREVLAFEPMP